VEDGGVVDATAVDYDAKNTILECLSNVKNVLAWADSDTTWVRQLAVKDGFKHANTEVDSKDGACGVLD